LEYEQTRNIGNVRLNFLLRGDWLCLVCRGLRSADYQSSWPLTVKAKRVRIHTAGDFFSQDYFDGWLAFCLRHSDVHFWAFTKSLKFWVARIGQIPPNLMLQASKGGREDDLIAKHGLKYAEVVWSGAEAASKGLAVDVDDYLAAYGSKPFALLENFTAPKQAQL
jgi:hypothetical protein